MSIRRVVELTKSLVWLDIGNLLNPRVKRLILSVGNLHLEGYQMPWENADEKYPNTLAHPRRILIEASNGCSDYGNKFGEPVIGGYCRSFGMRLANNERFEYLKPILFSGGVGLIDDEFVEKYKPEKGQMVAKIGGPVYRIGLSTTIIM